MELQREVSPAAFLLDGMVRDLYLESICHVLAGCSFIYGCVHGLM